MNNAASKAGSGEPAVDRLREAASHVIEYVEWYPQLLRLTPKFMEDIEALRAALAQPDEGAKLAQMVLLLSDGKAHDLTILAEQARKVLNADL